MGLYAEILKGEAHVHVPKVVPELSTGRLLTMEWLDGEKLLAFKTADAEARNAVALNMFRAWYVPFYNFGVIHGDPHLGNYTVRPDLDINLLDFGCVRLFPPRFVKGVIDLFWPDAQRPGSCVEAYESWDSRTTRRGIDVLNQWATFLYGPLIGGPAPADQERHAAARPRGGGPVHRSCASRWRYATAHLRVLSWTAPPSPRSVSCTWRRDQLAQDVL